MIERTPKKVDAIMKKSMQEVGMPHEYMSYAKKKITIMKMIGQ